MAMKVRGKRLGISKDLDRAYDVDRLKETSDDYSEKMKEIDALGEKFLSDKAKIEEQISRVEKMGDRKAKQSLLAELKADLEIMQKEYDDQVAKKQEELVELSNQNLENMDITAEEIGEEEKELGETSLDASSVDLSKAADIAAQKREEIEKYREQCARELELKIQASQKQMQEMRRRRLSGGGN